MPRNGRPRQDQLPPYVKAVRSGARVHYYVRHGGKYHKLPGHPLDSADGAESYAAARRSIEEKASPAPRKVIAGSVHAMIIDYKSAPEFRTLAPKTQRDYARALDHLGGALGAFPVRLINRAHIIKLRNKVAGSGNRTADLFIAVTARAFGVGRDLGYCDLNPAADISRINDANPYLPWPAEARALFEASAPPDPLLRAYMISLYTSLRLSNVLSLARTRYDGAGFRVHHSKSDKLSGDVFEHYIPAAKKLRDYLAKFPGDGLLFVTQPDGRRYSERAFSDAFRAHLDGLGPAFADLTFHGLRKTSAVALAEAGASTNELQSVFGWRTSSMASHYTRGAEQRKLATAAISKLDRNTRGKR